MTRRYVLVGIVFVLAIGLAFFWVDKGKGRESLERTTPAVTLEALPEPKDPSDDPHDADVDITKTVSDRKVRDRLRQRILAGWSTGDGDVAAAARSGTFPAMPASPDGGVDPQYIRSVIRDDFVPLASKCYEEFLTRKDAGGVLTFKFKVVGDKKIGGIVDSADVETDGGLDDDKLSTCVRESLLSLAFRPPPGDGWVTVTYPMTFAPSDPSDE